MSKCIGCGSTLTLTPNKEGYTQNLDNKLCERCFRIRNYNEYKTVAKSNSEYYKIIDSIDSGLIVLVVDIFDIPENFNDLLKHIKTKVLLVLTKFDLIPSYNEDKFIKYFNEHYDINIKDSIIISSKKNYHLDELYSMIKMHSKKNSKVYFIGFTNAGKSSLINKLIYNYSDNKTVITTSNIPSTTLDTIEIKLNDLELVDTPGIVSQCSLINIISDDYLKKLIPTSRIKPITYQVKSEQYIKVEDWFEIKCHNNNLVFYFSNKLDINRYYKERKIKGVKKHLTIPGDSDLVIPGAGFIRIMNDDEVEISVKENINYYIRKSIM